MNRRSMRGAAAVVLILAVGGVACGSGGKSKDAASAQAPEDLRAPAAAVTAGLGTVNSLTAQIALAASADARSAKQLNAGIEPAWRVIEGTVRANDKDLYIRFEDDFAALTKAADTGDGPKAQQAAADISEAVKAYQAKFPG